ITTSHRSGSFYSLVVQFSKINFFVCHQQVISLATLISYHTHSIIASFFEFIFQIHFGLLTQAFVPGRISWPEI
ncbi:hypothetical protein, partial [Paenibacillus sp. HGF5]|uniref:hypothetical protein n=1 Tax=Paenibacillus sp. HGF5 TaxID=908341 RepID=UPI001C310395